MTTTLDLAAYATARAILYTTMLGLPIVVADWVGPMLLGGRS